MVQFGKKIAEHRRRLGLTQEGLANRLNVTNQAVSKWEADQSCPDVTLLPELAELFGITLDELFGRPPLPLPAKEVEICYRDLPWEDNDDLHAVLFQGHRLQSRKRLGNRLAFSKTDLQFSGYVNDLHSEFAVICTNTTVKGSVFAGDEVSCQTVGGGVSAGDAVYCGDVTGDVKAGDGVSCGNVGGSVHAGDSVNCGNVGGSVTAGDSVRCGIVSGGINAG